MVNLSRTQAEVTHEYEDSQLPCIVARKPCGCYVATHILSERCLQEIASFNFSDWGDDYEEEEDENGDPIPSVPSWLETQIRPGLLQFLKDAATYSAAFEVRPVSFVRSGGLNSNCNHKAEKAEATNV